MKKEKEIERVIEEYLANKNAVLNEDFTETLLSEIEELGVKSEKQSRGVRYLIPVASLGFDYALKSNHIISGIFQFQELPYESKSESNTYLYYTIGF